MAGTSQDFASEDSRIPLHLNRINIWGPKQPYLPPHIMRLSSLNKAAANMPASKIQSIKANTHSPHNATLGMAKFAFLRDSVRPHFCHSALRTDLFLETRESCSPMSKLMARSRLPKA